MGSETISIGNELLSAEISSLGAELIRWQDGDGCDLLWDGDPTFWTGRAPLLFPIVGALAGDRYRFEGQSYSLPKHGFARRRNFLIVEREAASVLLRLNADAETRAVYPFDFRLDMRFSVDGPALAMVATVENRGAGAMLASFGFHPAFRWPLPYGQPRDTHGIRFEEAEAGPIRRVDESGLMTQALHASPVAGDRLALADDLFENDAIVFDRLASRRLIYGAEEGPQIEVEFTDMPHLGIWTKPGAGYICIEPWQGYADPVGFAGDIRDKPGIIELAPGAKRSFTMTMRLVR